MIQLGTHTLSARVGLHGAQPDWPMLLKGITCAKASTGSAVLSASQQQHRDSGCGEDWRDGLLHLL